MLRTFLLSLAFLFSSAFSLFTEDEVKSYPVQNGSIEVDGKLDSVWVAILNERVNPGSRLDLSDCSKFLNIARSDTAKCKNGELADSGTIDLLSGYDDDFLYFFFTIDVTGLFDGSELCNDSSAWKLDAIEFYLDPHQWDSSGYRQTFNPDANDAWFGTSASTIHINKPTHPNDDRIYLADRTKNNVFEKRTFQEFLESHPGFAFASGFIDCSTTIGLEFRIPRYADLLKTGPLAGNGTYFIFGYLDYQNKPPRDCSNDVPVVYGWSNQIAYEPPDTPDGQGYLYSFYRPGRSRDSWGKLTFQPEFSQNLLRQNSNHAIQKIRVIGTRVYIPGNKTGKLMIHNNLGKQIVSVSVQNGVADLGEIGLKQGLYFGKIDGSVYLIPSGIN